MEALTEYLSKLGLSSVMAGFFNCSNRLQAS
jgi:hypothetical protein